MHRRAAEVTIIHRKHHLFWPPLSLRSPVPGCGAGCRTLLAAIFDEAPNSNTSREVISPSAQLLRFEVLARDIESHPACHEKPFPAGSDSGAGPSAGAFAVFLWSAARQDRAVVIYRQRRISEKHGDDYDAVIAIAGHSFWLEA